MKRALQALVLLLLLPIPVLSQSMPCSDPENTIIDTVKAELDVASGSSSSTIMWEYLVERTSTNQISFRIAVPSIRFSGDSTWVNSATTVQIFDLIAMATVSNGVSMGTPTCPSSCGAPSYASVVQPSCVERSGSGSSTQFTSCPSSGCCIRTYSVCCPNGSGSPVIMLVSSQNSGCSGIGPSGNCSSTCP